MLSWITEMKLSEAIIELKNLLIDMLENQASGDTIDEDKDSRAKELVTIIQKELIYNPGTLIYFEDELEIDSVKGVVDWVWQNLNPQVAFEEMTGGEYTDLLVHTMGEYVDRAKMLKPTFISTNPANNDFQVYYEEAMHCWLFGLDRAALILCSSIVESLIKQKVSEINEEYLYQEENGKGRRREKTFKQLIEMVKFLKLINSSQANAMHDIRRSRNQAVHSLETISEKETHSKIMQTKEIAEGLLK